MEPSAIHGKATKANTSKQALKLKDLDEGSGTTTDKHDPSLETVSINVGQWYADSRGPETNNLYTE